jgi:hypothetical protein
MRAIYPKFLNKKAELFGLEMKDIFLCMVMIAMMKFLDISDLIVIGVPAVYLGTKFVINLFFPKFHFFFFIRRKKYLDWSRAIKRL